MSALRISQSMVSDCDHNCFRLGRLYLFSQSRLRFSARREDLRIFMLVSAGSADLGRDITIV